MEQIGLSFEFLRRIFVEIDVEGKEIFGLDAGKI